MEATSPVATTKRRRTDFVEDEQDHPKPWSPNLNRTPKLVVPYHLNPDLCCKAMLSK